MFGNDPEDLANRISLGVGGPMAMLVGTFTIEGSPVFALLAVAAVAAGPVATWRAHRSTDSAGDELESDKTEVVTDGGPK
jgi:hypothetical protein